jgi:serine/threonine protein kinase/tetratricopeptide (TPR) repeat protein
LTLPSGTRVGPYEIVASIGAGGMGEVYRARDPKLDREIALKVLSSELASSNEHLRRFEYEARAASALNHPNIVSIYDVGRDEGHAYIAMELIEGRDLRERSADGALSLEFVLRVCTKLADGLAAAHERGIVHRDLKPENVIVSKDGFVKILDFGLAKLVRQIGQNDSTMPHTTPGAVFGTVGYMSPEQAMGKATDFRSDQFSIGVIIYELMTMRRPFDRPSAPETMAAIIRDEPKLLRQLRPDCPRDLEKIVARCLAKEPHDRYASTRDLARDLREVRNMITTPSRGERISTARPRYVARIRRRLPAIAIVSAIIAIAVAGATWWRTRGTAPPKPSIQSLGVLPFRDLSGNPGGQHFADGIAETISSRLAQSNAIRVASFVDGGVKGTLQEIAKRGGADRLLRGSVQRERDQVRVTYAIVDPASGEETGGNTITGVITDIFTLEDQVAENVLQSLRVAHQPARRAAPTGLDRADDQTAYLEAVGLLTTAKDLASIDDAIRKLESILPNARDSAAVNAQLSRALIAKYALNRQKSLVEDATLYAERAAQFDPNLPEAQFALGYARLITGRAAEAAESFNRSIAQQPSLGEAYTGLGETYEAMGRVADADRAYLRAIQLRPDWPTAFTKYGSFCLTRGRYADALKQFRRVVELLPDSARGYANLGAALQELRKTDEAIAAYQRAIAIAPSAIAYSNLGMIEFAVGRYGEAGRAFEKAAEIAPNNYQIWANLGDAHRWNRSAADAAKAYEKAIDAAHAAIDINPKNAVARAVVASCLAKTGRTGEAEKEIHAAVVLDPTNANVLYYSAIVAELRGDSDAAMESLRRAVKNGFAPADAAADPDLRKLRERPEFHELLKKT